jgi:methylated-DNA-[protein]-cysteine S-methyltransferase
MPASPAPELDDPAATAWTLAPSPVGALLLTATEAGLTRVYFERHRHMDRIDPMWRPMAAAPGAAAEMLAQAMAELAEYFAGARREFTVPLAARGTEFQHRVWAALREIRWGTTESYGALARRLGNSMAVRAVAGANARNPLSIVVPCHRVIGADGALTGFGGGMARKRWLLTHEGALRDASVLELGLDD